MQHRIGIDVGGTNTDAVLMQQTSAVPSDIRGVMIGTTHFTNAVVQRRHLRPVAAVRLGLPATECVPPLTDWPEDLRELVGQVTYMLPGGRARRDGWSASRHGAGDRCRGDPTDLSPQ